MAAIGTAALTFRDLLQNALPTVIGVLLLVPRTDADELVIVAAVIFGYFLAPIAELVVARIYKHTPFLRKRIRALDNERARIAARWNYKRLFYYLDKDEREYLYQTAAYANFFRTTSFVFLLYILAIAVTAVEISNGRPVFHAAMPIRVIVDQAAAPAWLAILGAAVIWLSAVREYLREYKILFQDQYDEFARRYQLEKGDIARSVWGSVSNADGSAAACVCVTLTLDGFHEKATTDAGGHFIFEDVLQRLGKGTATVAVAESAAACSTIEVNAKVVPEVTLRIRTRG